MANQDTSSRKRPWHLWATGVVSLLWNAFGCLDYTMTQTRNAAYLSAFTAEQRAYFESFPAWMEAFWALGVWGALAGSIALLLASRHAVTLFALSLLGLLVSTIWQFGFASIKPSDIMPAEAHYITIVIWLIAIALLYYAYRLKQRGNLR